MRNISNERFIATDVLIQFEDGPASVRIPRGATLGELSETLHDICQWHRGGALSIDVRFGAANGSGHACAHPLVSSLNSQMSALPAMSP